VFDEFIAKGAEWFSMGTKLVELFANRVVERRNVIISIYRRELVLRVLRGVWFRGSFCVSELFVLLSFS
jgi:hypothetical protein